MPYFAYFGFGFKCGYDDCECAKFAKIANKPVVNQSINQASNRSYIDLPPLVSISNEFVLLGRDYSIAVKIDHLTHTLM